MEHDVMTTASEEKVASIALPTNEHSIAKPLLPSIAPHVSELAVKNKVQAQTIKKMAEKNAEMEATKRHELQAQKIADNFASDHIKAKKLGDTAQTGGIGAASVSAVWTQVKKTQCSQRRRSGRVSNTYYWSRESAEDACACNSACHAIEDYNCDGTGRWVLCKAKSTWAATSRDTCLYEQSAVAAPYMPYSDRMGVKANNLLPFTSNY